jgi:hypothetical protein
MGRISGDAPPNGRRNLDLGTALRFARGGTGVTEVDNEQKENFGRVPITGAETLSRPARLL